MIKEKVKSDDEIEDPLHSSVMAQFATILFDLILVIVISAVQFGFIEALPKLESRTGSLHDEVLHFTFFIWWSVWILAVLGHTISLVFMRRDLAGYSTRVSESVNLEAERLRVHLAKAFGELLNVEIDQVAPQMTSHERMRTRELVSRINALLPSSGIENP